MDDNFPVSDPDATPAYKSLLGKISETYTYGQVKATHAVNVQLLETYWQIGQHIVEFEQGGNVRATYGKALISTLSRDLTLLHGKGFSRSNILYMRLLYLRSPISQKPSHQLSWSHFVELLKIDDDLERKFYENQSIAEKWSVPQLKRQKDTALFQRIALSKNKDELLIEYATYGMSSQLFVSKYQLYLPDKADLIALVNHTLRSEEGDHQKTE